MIAWRNKTTATKNILSTAIKANQDWHNLQETLNQKLYHAGFELMILKQSKVSGHSVNVHTVSMLTFTIGDVPLQTVTGAGKI